MLCGRRICRVGTVPRYLLVPVPHWPQADVLDEKSQPHSYALDPRFRVDLEQRSDQIHHNKTDKSDGKYRIIEQIVRNRISTVSVSGLTVRYMFFTDLDPDPGFFPNNDPDCFSVRIRILVKNTFFKGNNKNVVGNLYFNQKSTVGIFY